MEDYIAAQTTTFTETFNYAPACIASGDLISSISGTGTMAALIAGLPTNVAVLSIAGYTMTGDPAADMLGVKNAMIALMIAQTTNGTVGELDGKSINFNVVFANILNLACTQTLGYTINFNTAIPEAQQALEDFVSTVDTDLEEDFEGLCLEGDDLIADISGTGKMVELFAQIALLQSGGQIAVVSVAGIDYEGTPANMAAIAAAIKNLMIAQTTNGTISELNGKSIDILVLFANALNPDCEELVTFTITFDTYIPDNPLTVTCTNYEVGTDEDNCTALVTFAATVAGVPTPITVTYKIGTTVITSTHTFPIGSTTVDVTAENECKTVYCSFTVTVNDNENPVFTFVPASVTIQVNESSNPGVTGIATATDNCDVTVTFSDVWAVGSCAGKGVITRTWKAQDPTGNFVTEIQTITIIDTQTPAITCPADIVVDNDPDECSAVVTFASPVSLDQGYAEGWEAADFVTGDYAGWAKYNSNLASVVSGNGGITSFAGDRHGLITPPASGYSGVFSRIGGYNSNFCNGYRVRLSVYMDLDDPTVTANTYGWDLAVASNNQTGGHLRDFIFHTASNASGNILVGGSNNSNFTRRNDLANINHHEITTSGWYIFEWEFRDNGGVLAVDLNLLDAGGNWLWTETRSNPADLIATVVGGNRYLWFTFLATDNLAIDNAKIERYTGISSDWISGAAFPVGETIVTFTSADCCANNAQCSFTVTVIDAEEPTITCPVPIQPVYMTNGCTYVHSGTGWDATANDNCGVTAITYTLTGQTSGTGTTLHNVVFNAGETTVTWTAKDAALNSDVCSFTVTVSGITVSGQLVYNNSASTKMTNTVVELHQNGQKVYPKAGDDDVKTNADGNFTFTEVCQGNYEVHFTTTKPRGNINSTDAALVNYWVVNAGAPSNYIEVVHFFAGDVNANMNVIGDRIVNSTDASNIQAHYLSLGSVPFARGIWTFWKQGDPTINQNPYIGSDYPLITVAGPEPVNQNFYALVVGDFNRFHVPGAGKSGTEYLTLEYTDGVEVNTGTNFELPIYAGMDMEVGAISVNLEIPDGNWKVNNVYLMDDPGIPVQFMASDGTVRISWYSLQPMQLSKGDVLFTLQLTAADTFNDEYYFFGLADDNLNELADGSYKPIEKAVITVGVIKGSTVGIAQPAAPEQLQFANHPNPFRGTTNFVYSLPFEGKVTIDVHDIVGNKVQLVVDEAQSAGNHTVTMEAHSLQPGIYTATLVVKGPGGVLTRTIKVICN